MKLKCLFGYHEWGNQENIRDKDMGGLWLLTPLFLLFMFCGLPKECDKRCLKCGKIKVFDV